MRCLARIGLAAIGLAVAAPSVWADPPPAGSSAAPPPHVHKKGLFARLHRCSQCEAARLRAQGIPVPPSPTPVQGVVVERGKCVNCAGGVMPDGAYAADGHVGVGRAVVGDQAPGYAVVEPSPIGVAPARRALLAGRAAPTDRAVQQVSTAAPDPIAPSVNNDPHILGHLFGLGIIARDVRDAREARKNRKREKHAAISYGPTNQQVTDMPASVIYRK